MTKEEWIILRDAIVAWSYYEEYPYTITRPGSPVSPGWSTCLGPNGERWPPVAVAEHRFGRKFSYRFNQTGGATPTEEAWLYLHRQIMADLDAAIGTPSLSAIMFRQERPVLLETITAIIQQLEAADRVYKIAEVDLNVISQPFSVYEHIDQKFKL